MNDYTNTPVFCHICRRGCGYGRANTYTDRFGNTINECRWICSNCGGVVRNESDIVEKKKDE